MTIFLQTHIANSYFGGPSDLLLPASQLEFLLELVNPAPEELAR